MSENDNNKQSKKSENFRALAHFSQIGVTIAASIFVGVFLGKYLDGIFGTSPWLLLLFSLLGMGSAMKALFDIPKEKNNN